MTFKFSFNVDPEGMTVPYAPRSDEIRRNRGFVDLTGRPDKASEIAEGADSLLCAICWSALPKPDHRFSR
jgi:hypothetical protein